jgi:hypothetical protein
MSAPNSEWWSEPEHAAFVDDLLKNTPDSWDGDEGAETIAMEYVHELERRVEALGGSLGRWPDDAQDLSYDADLTDRIAQAIGDPGSIVGRKLGPSWGKGNDGYAENEETVTRWSTRAVEAVLAGWQDTERIRGTETVHLPAPDGAR